MSGDFNESISSPPTPPPSWAVRAVDVPVQTDGSREPGDKRGIAWLLLVLGAFALALLIGVIGYLFGRTTTSDSSTPTTASVTAVTAADGASVVSTPLSDGQAAAPTTSTPATTAAPTTTAPTTTTAAPPTTQAVTASTSGIFSEGDTRRAVFKGGIVYLGGEVPSQEVSDLIATRVSAIVGQQNVVVEYTINPAAPIPDSAPLHVADLVLFAPGTSEITDAFVPLLRLGTSLFEVSPNVTIDVIAHTDSDSSAAFNQGLSERRAEAIRQFWIAEGVDPSRITATGKGESEPIASNATAEGRQLNRRAEFIVSGILS